MKRLLMLSVLLSVAALQAIREGEYNPAMRRSAKLPGRGLITGEGAMAGGEVVGATTSGIIASDGNVVSNEQITSVTEAEAAQAGRGRRLVGRPARVGAQAKARPMTQ